MNPKVKKALIISGISLDVAVTIFLFVIAIIMLATMPKNQAEMQQAIEINGPFIGYLQVHNILYLTTNVIPLILLLALNVAGLILYIRKAGKTKATIADLSDEQREALKRELLKDMQASDEEKK